MVRCQQAFTLLELLLVIAIIAVLAGIITFALRPAENIQNATDAQVTAKAADIEKAISLYALDNNGELPDNILSYTSLGYHEICKPGGSLTGCIDLSDLLSDYLNEIPIDESRSTDDFSGYILKYNPEGNSIDVMSASEYESKTDEILAEGLVGYWKMDETSWNGTAGEVVDSSGNGNDGTAVGGVTTAVGKFGNGGMFDGSNDHIEIGNTDELKFIDDFSVAAWFKTTSSGILRTILSQGVTGDYLYSLFQNSNDTLHVKLYQVGSGAGYLEPVTPFSINNGEWRHVVGVISDNIAYLYVDGVLVVTDNTSAGTRDTSSPSGVFNIGSFTSSSHFWNGQIDEVRVYDRVLTASEVEGLYEWTPGPIAHWKFDEGSGTTAFDSSGNGNDGILTSGPSWVSGVYGNALSFDGIDDYVSIGDNNNLQLISTLTVSAWGKELTGRGPLVVKGSAYTGRNYNYRLGINVPNNTLEVGVSNLTNEYYGLPSYSNWVNWHYYTISADGNTLKWYIDGMLLGSRAAQDSYDGLAGYPLHIGSMGGNSISGQIDNVVIYNYARTQEQILEDMNNN